MENDQTFDIELVANATVRELLTNLNEAYTCTIRKYSQGTKVNVEEAPALKLEIVHGQKGSAFLRAWAATGGQTKNSRYTEFYADCTHRGDWREPELIGQRSCPDTEKFGSGEYLTVLACELIDWCVENTEVAQSSAQGVCFLGSNFEGYGERDFIASVIQIQKMGYEKFIPGIGNKLGFEYELPSTGSRVDAVEFNEQDEVITVIECQSGIQHGNYLDDEHFAKAIGRYPHSPEVSNSVKKVIVIAGGYYDWQLAAFKSQPLEVVLLRTVVIDGLVKLEVV